MTQQFEVGQLVLAKVPSYSKWPGVIVPETKIPEDVMRAKNNKSYCVFFYGNDPSFFWGDSKSIFPLEMTACENLAKKSKGLIKKAYQHAVDNKDNLLAVLEVQGNVTADQEELNEEPEYQEEEEEEKPDQESEFEDEQEVIKKSKRKPAVAKKLTLPAKRSRAKVESEDEVKKPLKKVQKKTKLSTPPAHLSWNDEEKFKHFWFIRTKLQKGLISRADPPTVDEMLLYSNILSKLESLNADKVVDLKVLSSTKLHKVLKAVIKLEKLQRPDDFKFHERSAKLLESWADMISSIKGVKAGREDSPLVGTATPLLETPDTTVDEKSLGFKTETDEDSKANISVASDTIADSFTVKEEGTTA